MTRTLRAYINDRLVGRLSAAQGLWSFAYSPDWQADSNAYALSPALPLAAGTISDTGTQRPVQWYFDNLLPEEGVRTLMAKEARLDAADAFGLLAFYGAESAGSLTLLADDAPATAPGELRPLADEALQARIESLPRVSLAAGAGKRISLAGAQHKLAVVARDGRLFEPVGQLASTHILKPDHPDPDYPHSVINEYFTMRLAALLKLRVPAVRRRYVPAPVYLVDRFDREAAAANTVRLHLIDACQALNLDRHFKYAAGSVEHLAALANRCAAPASARLRLYSWLVFNLLVGNSDAHLKNLSFLTNRRGIEMSPAYDLLAVAVYETPTFGHNIWPATALAWPLNGKARFGEIARADVLAAGAALGLTREVAARLLDAQARRIETLAAALTREIEQENARTLEQRPALAPTFAGELRCLRAISNIVIRDMAGRLRG